MDLRAAFSRWRTRKGLGVAGALLCVVLGLLAWPLEMVMPGLAYLSYDLTFFFQPRDIPTEAVIVSMDDRSRAALNPDSPERWSRGVHADLLDKVFRLGADAVVLDILFEGQGPDPEADARLAQALARHADRVVLAAEWKVVEKSESGQVALETWITPWRGLGTNLLWGLVNFARDRDGAIRRLWVEPEDRYESLAQRTLLMYAGDAGPEDHEWWFHYYGPRNTLNAIDYDRVFQQPDEETNLYAGKVLFVGANPDAPGLQDEFKTPFTRWTGVTESGVTLHATAFLNLLHQDALKRLWPGWELLVLVLSGAVLGFALAWLRPGWSLWAALVLVCGVMLCGTWFARAESVWMNWAVIALVQIPAATLWSFASHARLLVQEKKELETILEQTRLRPSTSTNAQQRMPDIPDHELLKCVGRGAYGEVWLARDVLGIYHAVKVVFRKTFLESAPFEREFRGIKKFTPVSRQHPGWVDILHVGRNDEAGYFFYIMEAGDDVERVQDINPETYEPRNLSGDLTQGQLPVPRCIDLGIALAEALHHLHGNGLIHRDIKPSNVIFVRGQPKFADIGLVTDIASQSDVSRIGTEGYMAPEGPGTPASDVYSLGKLLYEAGLGRDPRAFPEMPTRMFDLPDEDPAHRLYAVVARACESDPQRRFQTATELRDALQALQTTPST